MRYLRLATVLLPSLFLIASVAHIAAAASIPFSPSCSDFTNSSDCTDVGGQQYVCEQQADGTGRCVAAAPGGAGGLPQNTTCDPNNDQCGAGLVCSSDGTCQPDGSSPGGTNSLSPQGPGFNSGSPQGPGPSASGGNSLYNPLSAGTNLEQFLHDILGFVVRIGTIVVILMLVYIGYLFATSSVNPKNKDVAREALLWTIVGALILLGAQAIASGIAATTQALSSGS